MSIPWLTPDEAVCQETEKPAATATEKAGEKGPDIFDVDAAVQEVLTPLFRAIADAKVSRTTVEANSETIVAGQVVDTQKSTYQIASKLPGKYTIYLKEPDQQTRIYNNADGLTIALTGEAYVQLEKPITIAQAVDALPIAMGTYPEPVLALSLAGYDPAIPFIGGMKSLKVVDKNPFRGQTPATHLKGVQSDLVTWDLWLSDEETPRPLRMVVDLTEMLRASKQMRVPAAYQYQLRFDFLSWRFSGDVDDDLFTYTATPAAKKFDSVQQYLESIAGVVDDHPLLAQPMPNFAGVTLKGGAVTAEDLRGKVVVLDFWSTWCAPCIAAMPTLEEVTKRYADKDVVFYAVNVGEPAAKVRGFLSEQAWDVPVILDPQAEIAGVFRADAIPQRIIVGKSGIIESVHVGFRGNEALAKQLSDELNVLHVGGRIATAK